MNISRITRSLITVCLSLVLIALGVVCFIGLKENATDIRLYIKMIYIVILVVSILIYEILKKKLYKKISNNKLVYLYRYAYLACIVFLMNASSCYIQNTCFDTRIALQILITFINVVIIKRIIYNISTSDTLSASASILYIFLPKMIFNESMVYSYLSYGLTIILLGLLLIFKIIDETSQHRMKTKKYIGLTLLLVANIIIGILVNITSLFWVGILVIAILANKNTDFTHISFGQKRIDKAKHIFIKRLIYGIERIKINKLFIVLCIVAFTVVPLEYLLNGINQFVYNGYRSVLTISYNIVKDARTYYMYIFGIIVILEIIGAILRRKVDVKTTIMKSSFIGIVALTILTKNDIFQKYVFDTLLTLIFILNISNIYYNRDEKIKLLKEKN